jgi:hypothetical protein
MFTYFDVLCNWNLQHCSDRVLAPVFVSVEYMTVEIQQTACRIAVKSFCQAWLDHIRSCGIRFRYESNEVFSNIPNLYFC